MCFFKKKKVVKHVEEDMFLNQKEEASKKIYFCQISDNDDENSDRSRNALKTYCYIIAQYIVFVKGSPQVFTMSSPYFLPSVA